MKPTTIRINLIRVVLAALFPLICLLLWQGWLVLSASRQLAASQLQAHAWQVAQSESDPFVIARHSLAFASGQPDVRAIGPRCNEVLRAAMRGATGLNNFVRTDADGRAQCSVLPFTQGKDMSNDLWWREGQGRNSFYLARPQRGSISGQDVLIMALPIFSDGEFRGTLSTGVMIDRMRASLKKKSQSLEGAILVTDRRGRLIIDASGKGFTMLDAVQEALETPQVAHSSDGSEWTYAAAPLYGDEVLLVYAEPRQQVLMSMLARIWPSVVLPLLSILLVSLAIWIGTQRLILRWLRKLQALTARFARGEFESEMSGYAEAPVELRDFAHDLHNMADAINAQEQDLRNSLDTRTALTRELNHRVKNNLQIINSLMTMQADRAANPDVRDALGQARSRIAALGLIHRVLYDAHEEIGHNRVDMHWLMGELCRQLRSSFRSQSGVTLNCESTAVTLNVDQAVPVTLFAVEAITNAFQHGFRDGRMGHVHSSFSIAGNQATLSVVDEGSGFSTSAGKRQMGLDLMHSFAEQLSGTLDVNSGEQGTEVVLRFPARD